MLNVGTLKISSVCTFIVLFISVVSVKYGEANHFKIVVFSSFLILFTCAGYLFTLLECLKSSFLISLIEKFRTISTCLNLILYISILLLYANHFWLYEIVLKLNGDINESPGVKPISNQSFSICHWSFNSIT